MLCIKKLQRVGLQNNAARIPGQPVAEDVTLALCSAEDRLQSGSADVQSPQHIDAVVPPSPNPGPTTQPQPAIGHYYAAKTVVNSDSVTVFQCRLKTFLFSRAFSLPFSH